MLNFSKLSYVILQVSFECLTIIWNLGAPVLELRTFLRSCSVESSLRCGFLLLCSVLLNTVLSFLAPITECGKFSSSLYFLIVPLVRTQSAVVILQLLFYIVVMYTVYLETADFLTYKLSLVML